MAAVFMEASADSNLATCPTCGSLIDVADEEPYARIHCSNCGTCMRVRQQFASYEITGVLGEGGQGLVYRAVDSKLKRNVAIKLMRREYSADPLFVKRFESEARVMASLNHPNIVKVFSFGEDRGLLYLAMEMVDQGSLDAVMQQLGQVPEDRVLEVGIQIAKGLQAGLEKGLIHRDIKPGNILFADEHTAKIVDFGLAVLVEKQHEEEGDVWATPFYVAPEKLDGESEDFRSDMYSLAATLFHALAGRPPFLAETNSMSELKKIKSKPVHLQSYAPHVSNPTTYLIEKALAVKPEERWASYAEFIDNLEYARNEFRKRPKVRTRPLVTSSVDAGGSWVTLAIILLVVAGGLVFALKRNSQTAAKIGPEIVEKQEPDEAASVRYEQARFQLNNQHFGRAAALFRSVFQENVLPEPKHSWAGFHEGLAELFDGRSVPARTAFERLGQNIAEKSIGMDRDLAAFFQRFVELTLTKDTLTLKEAETFQKTNHEAVALLAFGLKNWEAGAHAEAVAFFRQFQGAELDAGASWVAEYRNLITPYLEEHAGFANLVAELTKYEAAPEEAEAALQRIPAVKEKIRSLGLRAELKKLEEELGPKILAASAAKREEMARKEAEMQTADAKALTDGKLHIRGLCENYQFRDALINIRAVSVKLPKNIEERDLLVRRVEWLVRFKEQLIRDLTTGGGYQATVYRKNNTPLPGVVASADENQINLRIGLGSAMARWSELAPTSVLAMAKSFFRPTLPPAELATRQWHAGVFCIFTGLAESETLMSQAAVENPEYRLHKALFFGEPTEPTPAPAPQPEQPAPDATIPAASPTGTAPGTGLEMSNDALNPSRKPGEESVIRGLRRPNQ